MPSPDPTASCSKAPRGLFVLPRVGRIFTASSISPGSSLRQRPDRYTFRAGRNLPDKEFRYLRTVIVTAAVYRGFGSRLAPLPLTFRHWAGVSPYTSASALAGTCVFGKQSPGPVLCAPLTLHAASGFTLHGVPLLPKLRGQLAEFLDEGSPVHLGALAPAHLCRFAVRALAASPRWLFSEVRLNRIPRAGASRFPTPRIVASEGRRHCGLRRTMSNRRARPTLPRTSLGLCRPRAVTEYQPLSIAYASRPRLRPD